MEVETNTPTGEAKPQVSGLERLEAEFNQPNKEEQEKQPEAEPEKSPELTPEKPAVDPLKPADTLANTPEAEPEPSFGDEEKPAAEDGSWKPVFEHLGLEVPTDYSEENAYDALKNSFTNKLNQVREESRSFSILDSISEIPQERQAEARLIVDLMKQGQTIEQIQAPFNHIKDLKSMSPEQLVRHNFSLAEGATQETIDFNMEKLKTEGKLDLAYKALMVDVNNLEKRITLERENQIQNFTNQHNQIRESQRQQDLTSFKAALNRMSTFMDIKLNDANKKSLESDYASFEKLKNNPEKIVEFLAWDRYGKKGLEIMQARALEKSTLEQKKKDLNIPPTDGGGGRSEANKNQTGVERVEAQYAAGNT